MVNKGKFMRKIKLILLLSAPVFIYSWTVAYTLMFLARGDGFDFSFYFEYLKLSLTGSGLMLPSFILLFSLVIYLVTMVITYLIVTKVFAKKIKNL